MVDDVHPSEHISGLSRPISEVPKIVKRVHDYKCGHAFIEEMRTLLQQNRLWNAEVENILSTAVEKCSHCIAAAPPASKRTVSIAEISRQSSDIVRVNHVWLENTCLFHIVDHYSRDSAAQPISTTSIAEATVVFENFWVVQLWSPKEVYG